MQWLAILPRGQLFAQFSLRTSYFLSQSTGAAEYTDYIFVQLSEAVEYTDCNSAEELDSP